MGPEGLVGGLKEYGDKLSAENRAKIEAAVERLKQAHESRNVIEIESAVEQLNQAWSDASQELYQAQQEAQAAPDGAAQGDQTQTEPEGGFKDVEYEVVEDDEPQS